MLGPTIDRIAGIKFQDVSIGKSLLYFLGLEFAKVFTASLQKFKVPALATGAGMAYAVRKVGVVRRLLGETGSDVVSITMLAGGADEQFGLGEKVDSAVAKLAISTGVMEWQEAVQKRFLSIEQVADILKISNTAVWSQYREWRSARGLSSPEIAAAEVAAPVAVGNPVAETPVGVADIATPAADDLGAQEYLTSVERKIKAISER